MKVVYKRTLGEEILRQIRIARAAEREIDYIELPTEDFDRLRRELRDSTWPPPLHIFPQAINIVRCHGVEVRRDPPNPVYSGCGS